MKPEVFLDGERYFGKRDDSVSAKEIADEFYSIAQDMGGLRVELEDGSFLVLSKEATQRAHLLFRV